MNFKVTLKKYLPYSFHNLPRFYSVRRKYTYYENKHFCKFFMIFFWTDPWICFHLRFNTFSAKSLKTEMHLKSLSRYWPEYLSHPILANQSWVCRIDVKRTCRWEQMSHFPPVVICAVSFVARSIIQFGIRGLTRSFEYWAIDGLLIQCSNL